MERSLYSSEKARLFKKYSKRQKGVCIFLKKNIKQNAEAIY